MDALIVLTLGVYNLHGLVLVDEHTTVTYLSTHFTIEGSGIEHKLVELILLLGYLSVAENMTVVFGIVVAYKLLFTLCQFYPVAVLYSCGITGTILLFLHLNVELLLINGKTVLTTNQLCEVQGETIGVEQTEGLNAIQLVLALSLQFFHSFVKQGDSLVKCAEKRIFLFLDNLGNQLLLSLQFGEGIAHLVNEGGDEFIEETIFLAEESVSVANGTSQDTTNHIAGLCIGRQLSVCN